MSKWPPCDVVCNSIDRGPHFDGEIVLHTFTDNKELRIVFEPPKYWTYCFFQKARARWTRLAGGRETVEEARDLALMVLREPVELVRLGGGQQFAAAIKTPLSMSRRVRTCWPSRLLPRMTRKERLSACTGV